MIRVLVSFDLPDELMDEIRRATPDARVAKAVEEDELVKLVRDVEVVLAGRFTPRMLKAATRLKWVHSTSAGIDPYLFPEFVESPVLLTNSSGLHPTQVSEHAFGLMIAFTRRLHEFIRLQAERKWKQPPVDELHELAGSTLGVIGLGDIGAETARRAKSFGMKTIAVDKWLFHVPPYVDELVPAERLEELLQRSDFVVVAAPLTPETRGMIAEKALRAMRRTAYLINIARGGIIQEDRLVQALKEGWIAGAGLDVFETEPLPASSELWALPNVIVTPHIAGAKAGLRKQWITLFNENLRRFRENRPLINLVDKRAGF